MAIIVNPNGAAAEVDLTGEDRHIAPEVTHSAPPLDYGLLLDSVKRAANSLEGEPSRKDAMAAVRSYMREVRAIAVVMRRTRVQDRAHRQTLDQVFGTAHSIIQTTYHQTLEVVRGDVRHLLRFLMGDAA